MDRLRWLRNVLEVIAQFASEKFQRSAWVEFNGPDGASFEEACELLEDYHLGTIISSRSDPYQLQPEERRVLSEFWRTLDQYSTHIYETRVKNPKDNYAAPEMMISQPEWLKVRGTALAALKYFKDSGFSPMPRLPIFDRTGIKVLTEYWEV